MVEQCIPYLSIISTSRIIDSRPSDLQTCSTVKLRRQNAPTVRLSVKLRRQNAPIVRLSVKLRRENAPIVRLSVKLRRENAQVHCN